MSDTSKVIAIHGDYTITQGEFVKELPRIYTHLASSAIFSNAVSEDNATAMIKDAVGRVPDEAFEKGNLEVTTNKILGINKRASILTGVYWTLLWEKEHQYKLGQHVLKQTELEHLTAEFKNGNWEDGVKRLDYHLAETYDLHRLFGLGTDHSVSTNNPEGSTSVYLTMSNPASAIIELIGSVMQNSHEVEYTMYFESDVTQTGEILKVCQRIWEDGGIEGSNSWGMWFQDFLLEFTLCPESNYRDLIHLIASRIQYSRESYLDIYDDSATPPDWYLRALRATEYKTYDELKALYGDRWDQLWLEPMDFSSSMSDPFIITTPEPPLT